ncbi:MAG: DUF1153 domain-containing protein [Paracoccus sp. (in: a-proteobacteria)]|nr:DUF1153 domain-containing protein [Paracoccus sp. (in: a-proteobacteria)]
MCIENHDPKRVATLPDGSVLSLADLPPVDTRWIARRKAVVVKAVACGLISRDEVLTRYGLSEEELDSWQNAYLRHGQAALRSTALQKYRQL